MEIKDTHPYVRAMEQIKRRVDTINACSDGRVRLSGPPRVECAALQLRMVLELIALASLAANKELFQKQSIRFEKRWHPGEIIKDLEKLNPRFYPIPFRSSEPDDSGVRSHLPFDRFLSKDKLVEVHGRCGNVLHARNPFGKPIDYEKFLLDVLAWTNDVTSLLNTHEIWLLGDDHFHVVNMTEEGNDAVRMYTFQRSDV
ncbi:hypothetical protein ELE36_17480 [Pseudolysobacter antarcticus]|uniref:HEPN AbiU2-like domain-containing protein n=1 Tax=Pseudolysobacter antarcticus TaxID=2511995 RepID=A0A411HNE9_9GAMM|nr:hypothetical protein [Pseudolysobacter antarcticus]QBB72011.1 hypothetical protein ELE36_17480 [Pseudolysobacter antarcticus]